MEEKEDVTQDSSPEEEAEETEAEEAEETPIVKEDVKPAADSVPKKTEKVVPYERFQEVVNDLKKLKDRPAKVVDKSLDVEDYIDISTSLEGLDPREKAYLAKEHKTTGKALSEIRKGEDFLLWQSAWRAKVEKEKSLKPSGTQPDEDKAISLDEALSNASPEEQEKLLKEHMGYSIGTKYRSDRVQIQK